MCPVEKTPAVRVANGGEIYVPDLAMWEDLFRAGTFRGRKLFAPDMRNLIRMHLDLARSYPELSLAFQALPKHQEFWLVCMLLDTHAGLQRVHIERLTCAVCGWFGPTANPMVPDLYYGIADRSEVMRTVEIHPVLPCPQCRSKLPRHPIWVQPLSD